MKQAPCYIGAEQDTQYEVSDTIHCFGSHFIGLNVEKLKSSFRDVHDGASFALSGTSIGPGSSHKSTAFGPVGGPRKRGLIVEDLM